MRLSIADAIAAKSEGQCRVPNVVADRSGTDPFVEAKATHA